MSDGPKSAINRVDKRYEPTYGCGMPNLLVIGPRPSPTERYGRLTQQLLPRFSQRFDSLGFIPLLPLPDDEIPPAGVRLYQANLGDPESVREVVGAGWTHILVIGRPTDLSAAIAAGITAHALPQSLVYCWIMLETPFINTAYAGLASNFDFTVTTGGIVSAAYRESMSGLETVSKSVFKSSLELREILPGVDPTVFRPVSSYHFDFDRAELRNQLYGGQVTDRDFLIMVPGPARPSSGLSQAFATIGQLRERLDRRVCAYFHLPFSPELALLAAGNGLEVGETAFFQRSEFLTDRELNYVYNTADLVLCTAQADAWPFSLVEAMAAGTVVAAPAEHAWLEVINEGRGIELPTDQFTTSAWDSTQFVRHPTPASAAEAIYKSFSTNDFKERREKAVAWAQVNPASHWEHTAQQWFGLFGL